VGFGKVEVFPFPKAQFHDVGLPVERSWKLTMSGEQPDNGLAVKLDTGACPYTFECAIIANAEKAISLVRIMYSLVVLNGT